MNDCTIYDSVGKLIRTVSCPQSMLYAQKQQGEFIVFGKANPATDWVNQGEIQNRQPQLTELDKQLLSADGIDVIHIINAPNGTFKAINIDTLDTVTGTINGADTFSTTILGDHTITIMSWPYLDFTTTIKAI